MRCHVFICLSLAASAAGYTPRMFRPGGQFYTHPKSGPGSDGIDDATRAQLSGLLNGILTNLQHHKAALPQVADIVQQYHLGQNSSAALLTMYKQLNSTQGKAKAVLASVLQKVDSTYTPRMFQEGGKFYTPPHYNRNNGISAKTKKEVGDILKGMLGNLMKHKAALSQAKEIVQQFKPDADVMEGLQDLYSSGLKDEKALSSEADRSQAKAVLALVIQQANATYTPGAFRPRKYSGYHPSRSRGSGISKATRDQVGGILKGILENLTKHKAALGQLAEDVTHKYQGNSDVAQGLKGAFDDLTNQKELAGASVEVQGQVKTVLASVLAKVVHH